MYSVYSITVYEIIHLSILVSLYYWLSSSLFNTLIAAHSPKLLVDIFNSECNATIILALLPPVLYDQAVNTLFFFSFYLNPQMLHTPTLINFQTTFLHFLSHSFSFYIHLLTTSYFVLFIYCLLCCYHYLTFIMLFAVLFVMSTMFLIMHGILTFTPFIAH